MTGNLLHLSENNIVILSCHKLATFGEIAKMTTQPAVDVISLGYDYEHTHNMATICKHYYV
jgi:hypothetical protein